MPTREAAWPAGTPCWVDYSATDIDGAKAFYTELFGWAYGGGQEEYGGYLNCQVKRLPAAGMMATMDSAQVAAWTTYFATEDAEATVAAVVSAGGTIVAAPMDVGPLGRMALALDSQGHLFGVWEAREHTGARIYNEPGAPIWNEAAVDDPDAARAFYTAVFGFRFEPVEGSQDYTTFTTDGDPLGGLGAHQDGKPSRWSTCFGVASARDAVHSTLRAGGAVLTPIQNTPYGHFAVLTDPWNAPFSIMQLADS